MPLASKDGKLYVKTEIDEDGNEVKKLCTSCCGGGGESSCCVWPTETVAFGFGDTASEAEDAATQDTEAQGYTYYSVGHETAEGVWQEGAVFTGGEDGAWECESRAWFPALGGPTCTIVENESECVGVLVQYRPNESCTNSCAEFPPTRSNPLP